MKIYSEHFRQTLKLFRRYRERLVTAHSRFKNEIIAARAWFAPNFTCMRFSVESWAILSKNVTELEKHFI